MSSCFSAVTCFAIAAALCHAQTNDAKGIGARATPADYQAHAQAGTFTLAADFAGHSVTTPDSVYSTEDYLIVEVGFFGPAAAHLKLSWQDFSIRINGKKAPAPAQAVLTVFKSLKDPEWEASVSLESKSSASKTGINTGGGGGQDSAPKAPPKMPIEVERRMELRVQKAALPEGDRPLPEGGLLFFPYHGKTSSIHSMELIYSGPAGKAIIELH